MFRTAFRLPFRLLGIPVKLDTSFLLILPLLAWLIGSQIPSYLSFFRQAGLEIDPDALQRGFMPYLVGLLAALGLFASVLLHELGHALAARLYRVEVKEITLWFLGGVAQFEDLPRARGAEAVVAIAGPLTSFSLAVLAWFSWRFAGENPAGLFILSYLAITNGTLGLFNLLPALPLDGGRILRSLLSLVLPHLQATRISALVSRLIAIGLGVYGFLSFNLFLLAIAFFVYNAVGAEARYALVTDTFEGRRVADLMSREVATVPPDLPLHQFVQLMYFKKYHGYPVVTDEGVLLGFALIKDVPEETSRRTVAAIMRPPTTIGPEQDAMEALKRLGESETGRLVVIDEAGKVVGLLSQSDLIRQLRNRNGPTPG